MIIELEPGIWIDEDSDTLQTDSKDKATEYSTMQEAVAALEEARLYYAFKDAVIVEDFLP